MSYFTQISLKTMIKILMRILTLTIQIFISSSINYKMQLQFKNARIQAPNREINVDTVRLLFLLNQKI
jgi:hypothetical protein